MLINRVFHACIHETNINSRAGCSKITYERAHRTIKSNLHKFRDCYTGSQIRTNLTI